MWSAFWLRGFERHGKFQTLLDHIGTVHRPVQPAVRRYGQLGSIVVNHIENDRIKADLEETHESDRLHRIWTTGCSSAQ